MEDDLPPFASLTTDEDWQRKAGHRPPGTYFVVANSASFADCDEYRNEIDDDGITATATATASEHHAFFSSPEHASQGRILSPLVTSGIALCGLEQARRRRPTENTPIDADTLLLGSLDDGPRRSRTRNRSEGIPSPVSPNLAWFSHNLDQLSMEPTLSNQAAQAEDRRTDHVANSDDQLLLFYRTFVRTEMLHIPKDTTSDWLEREAAGFPPVRRSASIGGEGLS